MDKELLDKIDIVFETLKTTRNFSLSYGTWEHRGFTKSDKEKINSILELYTTSNFNGTQNLSPEGRELLHRYGSYSNYIAAKQLSDEAVRLEV